MEVIFLRRRVVEARFGLTHYRWRAYESSCSHQAGLWICWKESSKHSSFRIGEGWGLVSWTISGMVTFLWVLDFVSFFTCLQIRGCCLDDAISLMGCLVVWNPRFRRHSQDWEIELLDVFTRSSDETGFPSGQNDLCFWFVRMYVISQLDSVHSTEILVQGFSK